MPVSAPQPVAVGVTRGILPSPPEGCVPVPSPRPSGDSGASGTPSAADEVSLQAIGLAPGPGRPQNRRRSPTGRWASELLSTSIFGVGHTGRRAHRSHETSAHSGERDGRVLVVSELCRGHWGDHDVGTREDGLLPTHAFPRDHHSACRRLRQRGRTRPSSPPRWLVGRDPSAPSGQSTFTGTIAASRERDSVQGGLLVGSRHRSLPRRSPSRPSTHDARSFWRSRASLDLHLAASSDRTRIA